MKPPIKRIAALVLFDLAVAIIIYWAVTSGKIFTLTQVPYEIKDELFGTTTIEWRDELKLGLEYAGSAAFALLIGAFFFWKSSRKPTLAR